MQSRSRTWLKTAGYILTAIYTVGIFFLSYVIVMITVLRHPTNVFPPLDAREWLFVSLLLALSFASGIVAILAARKLKEAFRVLYIPGTIAILWAIGFVPFQSLSSADYAFVDEMPNRDFLVDKWACHDARLTLSSDSTFVYAEFGMATASGDTVWQTGTWQLAGGIVVLSPAQEEYTLRWPVLESDGRQFIAHRLPANLEDWDGNLGLMREEEWRIVSGRY